jgi:PadR family transcriptional regulator, regulatory protein PadR
VGSVVATPTLLAPAPTGVRLPKCVVLMTLPDDGGAGLPRPFLRPVLFLLLAETPSHGYDLMERAKGLGMDSIDPGGLYRTLRAMEQEGLVESRWEASGSGPARRTYRLTSDGQDWLHVAAASVQAARDHLDGFLSRYGVVADLASTGPTADAARS